jgi:hypothetical protein
VLVALGSLAGIVAGLLGAWSPVQAVMVLRTIRSRTRRAYQLNVVQFRSAPLQALRSASRIRAALLRGLQAGPARSLWGADGDLCMSADVAVAPVMVYPAARRGSWQALAVWVSQVEHQVAAALGAPELASAAAHRSHK